MEIISYKIGDQNENIRRIISVLKNGGLVIFPSDTVYGALVDAGNEKAVKKLLAFKERPVGKAISVFISGFKMMKDYVEVKSEQEKILRQLLPGPFTVVLKSKHKIGNRHACSLLQSEIGTLGVRYVKYDLINQLIECYGKPVTATSANLAGQPPHYSVDSLLKSLPQSKKNLIDLIVDAGKLPRNKPSTVIDLTAPSVKVLRQGDKNFQNSKRYISNSPQETKKIANEIIVGANHDSPIPKPLIFIIEGELGVGKTIFVKGLAETFGIKNIISPTYVVYYEYDIKTSKFIHADLYNISEEEEFNHLGLEKYFKMGNIICFEWGEKLGDLYEKLVKVGKVVFVGMKYISKNKREIIISNIK